MRAGIGQTYLDFGQNVKRQVVENRDLMGRGEAKDPKSRCTA